MMANGNIQIHLPPDAADHLLGMLAPQDDSTVAPEFNPALSPIERINAIAPAPRRAFPPVGAAPNVQPAGTAPAAGPISVARPHQGFFSRLGGALGRIGGYGLSAVAPGIAAEIPSTPLGKIAAERREQERELGQAHIAGKQAETGEAQARTDLAKAQTEALEHPQPKSDVETSFISDYMKRNPDKTMEDALKAYTAATYKTPASAAEPKVAWFMGPDGKPVQGYTEGGQSFIGAPGSGSALPEGYVPYKAPTENKPVQGMLAGKPAFALYDSQKGWLDPQTKKPIEGFMPAPSWAESLLPTHTLQLTDPNTGLPGVYHWQMGANGAITLTPVTTPQSRTGTPPAVPGSGPYEHQIQSAQALLRMVDENVNPLVDQMAQKGELGIVKGRFSDWLNRDVGNAPPDVAQLHQLMNGVVSMMMGMYGFRRQQAVDMLTREMGARMTPESLRASLKGIIQHANSIVGGAVKSPGEQQGAGGVPSFSQWKASQKK